MQAQHTATLDVPASAVWALLSNFGDLSWIPGELDISVEGNGVGMVRRIALPGVGLIEEELVYSNAQEYQYSYAVSGPLPYPIENYRAEVSIAANGQESCNVTWRGEFDPMGNSQLNLREIMEQVYCDIAGWVSAWLSRPGSFD